MKLRNIILMTASIAMTACLEQAVIAIDAVINIIFLSFIMICF